jgi:diaminopimelate epimerase
MEFAKLHALGNDFLIVDVTGQEGYRRSLGPLARRMCHRHCGIGADGVLFFQATVADADADFAALIFNADGSKAEMSGNGVRCLAAYLYRNGKAAGSIRIRTVAGIKTLSLKGEEGTRYTFECSMGAPITAPNAIPARVPGKSDPILDYTISAGSENVQVTLTSFGNPHCSTFWPDINRAPVQTLGPILENHSIFPQKTNVEFIQVLDPHRLRVKFWERGVGLTFASGTGSCAAAVAAILLDRSVSPVTVETDLGSLLVTMEPGGEVFLTGEAEFICYGTYLDRDT